MFWSFTEFAKAYLAVASAILLLAVVSFVDRVFVGILLHAFGEYQRGWTAFLEATNELKAGLIRMTTVQALILSQISVVLTKRDGGIDPTTAALTIFANVAFVEIRTVVSDCCNQKSCYKAFELILRCLDVIRRRVFLAFWPFWYVCILLFYMWKRVYVSDPALTLEERRLETAKNFCLFGFLGITITVCYYRIKYPSRRFPSFFLLWVAKVVLICIYRCLGATSVLFRQLVRVQWFSWYCLVVALYIFQASNSEGLSLEEWQKPHNAKYVWAIIVEVIISLCCILEPFIPYYILTKYCGFHIPMSPYVQKSIARWKRVGIFAQKSKERLRNMKQLSCQFYIHIRDQFQRRTAAFLVLLTSSRIFWYFVFRLAVASVYAMLTR